MTLQEMIVIKNSTANPYNGPYRFWAVYTVTTSEGTEVKNVEVTIVMPLGGSGSALFRYPKPDEKVLVGIENNSNYLLGYLPDNPQDNIYTGDKDDQILPGQMAGQFFRYKNDGDNYTEYPYSEIGFYSKKHTETEEYKDETTKKNETYTFSKNELDIKSTGDIKNSASDNYSIKADSFNLGIGGDKKKNASIEVDANGKVTIKALDEIKLKVGKTSLSISDSGFSVSAKLGDTPLDNSWDAYLSLKPMKGFYASGMNCGLNAVRGITIEDSMGGKFSTSSGIGKIEGRELKMETLSKLEYTVFSVFSAWDFIYNTISFTEALKHEERQWNLDKAEDDLSQDDFEKAKKDKEKKDKAEKRMAYRMMWAAFIEEIIKDLIEITGKGLEVKEKW